LVNTLLTTGITVTRPERLSKSSSTRPELAVDSGGIVLFSPKRSLSTEDVLGFSSSETNGDIIIVNALPGLVRSAPRTTSTLIVEGSRRVSGSRISSKSVRDAGVQVRRVVNVVTGIVGDPATEA